MAQNEKSERVPGLHLRPGKDAWYLDPHLQELLLAESADPSYSPDPVVACRKEGRLWVDVIVKLESDGEGKLSIPTQLRNARQIGDIVTGTMASEDIEKVRPHVASLKAATGLFLSLDRSVAAVHCAPGDLHAALPEHPGLDGSEVIIGIVDVGCDVRHRSFRGPSGETRVLYLWDQSDSSDPGQAPQPYGYGREINAAMINRALPEPYQALGYTPPPGAHGTHVMDIAAGNGREQNRMAGAPGDAPAATSPQGVAPNAMLIFVNLKSDASVFLGNSRQLLDAVDYIFSKADKLGLPAVVNLSLSSSGGPHDGMTLVERGFENLLSKPGRAIVISAGNAYAKQSHIERTVQKRKPTELTWRIDPQAAKNEMEVWYDDAGGKRPLEATLIAPDGTELGPVQPGQTRDIYQGEARVGRISHRQDDPNNHLNQIDIRVPVLADGSDKWTVELSVPGGEVSFHAWIEQNDQGLAKFEGETTLSCTLGSICCGEKTLAVGAYDTFERASLARPYAATAAGKTRDGREKPDVSAPGVGIFAASAHGGTLQMSGTSMAAAHVTGMIALLFQLARRRGLSPLPIEITRDLVVKTAQPSPSSAGGGWDPRLGHGRINGIGAARALLALKELPEERTEAAVVVQAEPAETERYKTNGGNGHHPDPEAIAALLEKLASELGRPARVRVDVEPLEGN